MTDSTIASFNVKNLIGPDQEYYRFQSYTPEEYAWKRTWLADQIVNMNADVVAFQEIFDEDALRDVIGYADAEGREENEAHVPGVEKRYRRRAIFAKLEYGTYDDAALAFAPNVNDGAPGQRRPGVAILSRLGFSGEPEVIQAMDPPLAIPLNDGAGGHYTVTRLSRPLLKVRVPMGGVDVSVITCHLKSKLGEFICPEDANFAPEADLTRYDPVGRALGAARAALRRMAEAWVLRGLIVRELEAGHPVIVLGDFNDGEHAVSSEIISGEVPFKNYEWVLRHDAQGPQDRYSAAEHVQITTSMNAVRLHSAEKLFVAKSLRDMVYTTAFGGVYESIDQIYLSRHFLGEIGEMTYFSVFNDHLTDGIHPEAPYNKLASDHGQIMAHIRMKGENR